MIEVIETYSSKELDIDRMSWGLVLTQHRECVEISNQADIDALKRMLSNLEGEED